MMPNIDLLEKELETLNTREKKLNDELSILLSNQDSFERQMASIKNLVPALQIITQDAHNLSNTISFTAELADNISGKVRELDVTKSRVVACLQRAKDIIDLKKCTDGVKKALEDEEYEEAAAHIHRYLNIDPASLQLSSDPAEGSSLHQALLSLEDAEKKLKAIVNVKFDQAVEIGHLPEAMRFFKIFPLLNLHQIGLEKFCKHLCLQVNDHGDKELKKTLDIPFNNKRYPVIFSDYLTNLFEYTAEIVETYQPLVETYYGHGKLFNFVSMLQSACDTQVGRGINSFKSQRQFDTIFRRIQQSVLTQKSLSTTSNSLTQTDLSSTDKLDPRELDDFLAEITLINASCELYLRFIRRRLNSDCEAAYPLMDEMKTDACLNQLKEIDRFINHSGLSRILHEFINQYITIEDYFMRESIYKAILIDSPNMVDDVFFILRKCLKRTISSSNVEGICAMLNHAVSIIDTTYREQLHIRLKSGYPSGFDLSQAYTVIQSSIQLGKLQGSDIEKLKQIFLTTFNNVEITYGNLHTLKSLLDEELKKFLSLNEHNKTKLDTCLNEIHSAANRFKDLIEFACQQLCASAIKPRIKVLMDVYVTINHKLSEDEFSQFEANDPFLQNFIVQIDALFIPFKSILSTGNYDRLIAASTSEIVTIWEKVLIKCGFNRYGGLQFDKEVRGLMTYLTNATRLPIRDKFQRLTQIATLLCLEKLKEINDYWDPTSSKITWRLIPSEVRQILSLRTDFRSDDIRALKL
ncbi:unnamed protein product [Rotaria socialis]|uniref:Conserved oligomeric Golgi complex subunit 4 n=1 Tax=Rotaria socialis TaxID=392032 RepID=A0A818FPA9_9BILA|nr:unnamed protein product [Rotaria socialis]CAF4490003.1 unnamed protein product [Rotaria socialis]